MNAWIILLFLLMGNCNSDCSCKSGRSSRQSDRDCGCDRERGSNRNSDRSRNQEQDCGCNDSRFEPRFDSRPFRDGRETCGCEEKED